MREANDFDPKYVAFFAVGLTAAIAGAFVLVAWMFGILADQGKSGTALPPLVETDQSGPPEPRLQTNPEADNRAFIDSEREALQQYGWVDRERGIARIPIDRSIELMLQRGSK